MSEYLELEVPYWHISVAYFSSQIGWGYSVHFFKISHAKFLKKTTPAQPNNFKLV